MERTEDTKKCPLTCHLDFSHLMISSWTKRESDRLTSCICAWLAERQNGNTGDSSGKKTPNNSVDKKNLKVDIIFKYLTIDAKILNRDKGKILCSGNRNKACIAGEKGRSRDRETTWLTTVHTEKTVRFSPSQSCSTM